MQRNQQGFTLIELVIVIVILGILSAFALPRFADLGGDARAAAVEGAAGSMRSAASIVRSACLASSDCDANADEDGDDSEITLEGVEINLAFGYPVASTDTDEGILAAAQISGDDFNIQSENEGIRVAADGAPDDGAECRIDYEAPTEADETPDFDLDVSEC